MESLKDRIYQQLKTAANEWDSLRRVRLLLIWTNATNHSNDITIQSTPITTPFGQYPPAHIVLALQPLKDPQNNPFVMNKTTNRTLYEQPLNEARLYYQKNSISDNRNIPNIDDVVLYNESQQITETTIANIAILKKQPTTLDDNNTNSTSSRWITPPLSCGLLPGTMREELLRRGELTEGIITLQDMKEAVAIKFFNSVRGEYPAILHC